VVEPTTRCVDTESLSIFAPYILYRKDRHQAFPTIHAYEMYIFKIELFTFKGSFVYAVNFYLCTCLSKTLSNTVDESIKYWFRFSFMMFNATFNNISVISWLSVLLVGETGVPVENH